MKLDIRYAEHPDDVKAYTTEALRSHYLFDPVFIEDEINLCYTHVDRVVFGGAYPVAKSLRLEGGEDFGSEVFLDRRELGVITIGGEGRITVDGAVYEMAKGDGMYIGKGAKEVVFAAAGEDSPKFYLVSAPAHTAYPTCGFPSRRPIPAAWASRITATSAPSTSTCIRRPARAASSSWA